MQPAERIQVTDDEYIERERRAATKSELIHGEIVAIAGASPKHNAITANLIGALRQRIREQKRPCNVFTSDQRVHVEATGLYTYPDVSVACGGAVFHEKHRDTLLNPMVLIEVLSKSTEAYDRGAKFAHYRALPSFVEYLLVEQREKRVEHFRRLETGQWILTVYQGEDAALDLPTLNMVIPLSEIYDQTDALEPNDPEDAATR